MAGAVALLAVAAVGTAGATGQLSATHAPLFSVQSSVEPYADKAAPLALVPSSVAPATSASDAAPTASAQVSAKTPSAPGSSPTAPVDTVAQMAKATPVRVQIPAIGVDSALMGLGLQADGTMEMPPAGFPAGWYTGAPTPGELGPAVIAGHVDWGGRRGVFYDLRRLKPGAEVRVARDDGTAAVFRVTRVEQVPKDEFPTDAVYGDIDHAGLRLITCGGAFDRRARSYDDNIVVFADLIATPTA